MANPNLVPGPGRPRGSLNRINKALIETLDAIGCDPAIALAHIAMNTKNPLNIRANAYTTLFKSIYPMPKMIELSGDPDQPVQMKMKIEWAKETIDIDDSDE